MKKTLLLCLVFVMCWGGVFAAEVKLTYTPVIEQKTIFGVYDAAPTFSSGAIDGTLTASEKDIKTEQSVVIAWSYLLAEAKTQSLTVTLTSANAGKLKNINVETSLIDYTIQLTKLATGQIKNTTITVDETEKNLNTPVTFTIANTKLKGEQYNREFWGGVTMNVKKGADLAAENVINGAYKDTITVEITALV